MSCSKENSMRQVVFLKGSEVESKCTARTDDWKDRIFSPAREIIKQKEGERTQIANGIYQPYDREEVRNSGSFRHLTRQFPSSFYPGQAGAGNTSATGSDVQSQADQRQSRRYGDHSSGLETLVKDEPNQKLAASGEAEKNSEKFVKFDGREGETKDVKMAAEASYEANETYYSTFDCETEHGICKGECVAQNFCNFNTWL